MKEQLMYAIGHLALGYLSGKTASKILNVNINIPLLFLASVLPDVDLLIPALEPRRPLHSMIILCLLFLPTLMFFRKRAIPYFVAPIQHILIGDYLTGHIQLLWPMTTSWYGLGIGITSLTNIFIEWILFLTSIGIMVKAKDAWLLFQHHLSNLILFAPIFTVLLPAFLSFPISVPVELMIPNLTYLTIFSLSILTELKSILKSS